MPEAGSKEITLVLRARNVDEKNSAKVPAKKAEGSPVIPVHMCVLVVPLVGFRGDSLLQIAINRYRDEEAPE